MNLAGKTFRAVSNSENGSLNTETEMRFTSGGTAVATVSLATTEKFTDKEGQKREDTQWHRIVIWGKTAQSLHEYLTKGKQIYVEGRIQTRAWTDKEGTHSVALHGILSP